MDYIKKTIWGPTPKEQHRKCRSLIRKNTRQLDRSIQDLQILSNKTTKLIKTNAKKGDVKATRTFAKELYSIQKQQQRLSKSKAQLNSVGMQIDEAFAMSNLQQKISQSTLIMKEVNSLVKLPQIMSTMRELETELVKSGVITEMVGDSMDILDEDEELDEEVDEAVSNIISSLTSEKLDKVDHIPVSRLKESSPEPEDVEEDEEVLNEMRERLKALQN